MAIPRDKNELLMDIRSSYQKLKADLVDLHPNLFFKKELAGHSRNTQMSVANLVAYLIGWGELVLKWNSIIQSGSQPNFPDDGYKWTELGSLAQRFYSDYGALDFEESLKKLEEVVNSILNLVEKSSDEDLYGTNWYKNYTMGRMIQLNSSSPYKNARMRVRKWKRINRNKEHVKNKL